MDDESDEVAGAAPAGAARGSDRSSGAAAARSPRRPFRSALGAVLAAVAVAAPVAGAAGATRPSARAGTTIPVVAAENEYGNVVAQVGGRYVTVYSVESNPNTDPHTYEATPAVAQKIADAKLLVENGLGYDSFMDKLAAASPSRGRKLVDVQHLLGLPDATANPHLWYDPATMPAVARAVASDLATIDPSHASRFRANADAFVSSLRPWKDAIASFARAHRGATVATTEPVADDLLGAMGLRNVTPARFQDDVMNGTDPTPQDIATLEAALSRRKVRAFVYNEQVVDSVTASMLADAKKAGIPVVGVYETMPTPGYDYQTWMLAEEHAIANAVLRHVSTGRL